MKKGILIMIFVILMMMSGCIINDGENSDINNYNERCKYEYNLKIQCNSSNYSINVPLPVFSDDNGYINISPINDKLEVLKGKAYFRNEKTLFGPSLKINGSYNIEVGYFGDELDKFFINNDYTALFLSMVNDRDKDGFYNDDYGNVQYQIYCHQNITMNIIIEFHYRYEGEPGLYSSCDIYIVGKILQGWNKINGTINRVIE
jgi:hypothetical protein